jgi:hypothetical protein
MKEVVIQDRTNYSVEKVQNLVHSGRTLCVRAVVIQLNLDTGTLGQILSDDLSMKNVSAKMIHNC